MIIINEAHTDTPNAPNRPNTGHFYHPSQSAITKNELPTLTSLFSLSAQSRRSDRIYPYASQTPSQTPSQKRQQYDIRLPPYPSLYPSPKAFAEESHLISSHLYYTYCTLPLLPPQSATPATPHTRFTTQHSTALRRPQPPPSPPFSPLPPFPFPNHNHNHNRNLNLNLNLLPRHPDPDS
ncbi:hypothetical protein H4I96_08842 [Botrytis cinerea]